VHVPPFSMHSSLPLLRMLFGTSGAKSSLSASEFATDDWKHTAHTSWPTTRRAGMHEATRRSPRRKKTTTGCRFGPPAFDMYMEAIKMKIVVFVPWAWPSLHHHRQYRHLSPDDAKERCAACDAGDHPLGLSGMEVSRLLRAAGYSQCCIDERLSSWQGHIPAWDAVGYRWT
jgi:hypothetical protein